MIKVIGTPLSQWDVGRVVEVSGITADHVHFANKGDSHAVIMALENSQAKIPDYLLQSGKELCVYAVANGVTIERKSFFVTKRERPENYVYKEDQRNFVYKLITDAAEATEAANKAAEDLLAARDRGDFNGPQGEKGDPGEVNIDDTAVGENAWSSKNIVDKLCPSFEKTGTLVQCEPVEGYPLEVTAAGSGEFTVTACGKNLYNKGSYPLDTAGYPYSGSANNGMFSSSDNYRRTGFIPVSHLVKQTIVLNLSPLATNPGISFYTRIPDVNNSTDSKAAWCGGTNGASVKVPDNSKYMVFCVKAENANDDVQIEIGSAATDYEPYCSNTAAGSDGKAVVTAVKGMNNVFAYSGDSAVEITVVGRADPVAIIDKLTNAVDSLGGKV